MSIEDVNYVHKSNIDVAESALKPQEPIRAAFVSIPENQRKKAIDRSSLDREELNLLVKVFCIRESASKNTFTRQKIRVANYTINTLNIVVGVYLLKVTVAHPMCCMSNCSTTRLSLQI